MSKKIGEALRAKYGDDFYQKLGQSGGVKKVPKGVAINGRAAEIGSTGGKLSKRGHRYIKSTDKYNVYTLLTTGEIVKYPRG